MTDFSDYIIYVDESGDHSLTSIDPDYPVFVLTFCIVHKQEYADRIVPAIKKLKFEIFGHDDVILHEHEIRKCENDFKVLLNPKIREPFYERLSIIIADMPVTIIAAAINKPGLKRQYSNPFNPYDLALGFCLERAALFLKDKKQDGKLTHIIVEGRGKNEDRDLELQFRRIIQPSALKFSGTMSYAVDGISFDLRFTKKTANMAGLQLADMTARPIGRYVMDRDQSNRAMDILKTKLMKKGSCGVETFVDYGLKVFPSYPQKS
jgi:hypothetical protein